MDINQYFEKLYVKHAPSWSLERDPDGSYKYHATQSAFLLFEQQQLEIESLKAKSNAETEAVLENNCMIGQLWFPKGTPVSALIKQAENDYKAKVIAQNSKIEFGTDDNEHWFAHDVPYFGRVQISKFNEDGFVEWDICLSGCWQGPFSSKSKCIQHLEECIAEKREEEQEQAK